MVVIIDPHLKKDNNYPVYKSASEKGLLVKPASGEGEYDGWCWPGSSVWVDYFNPASWEWWKGIFKIEGNNGDWHWKDSTNDVFIWNDMNEVCYNPPAYYSSLIPFLAFGVQWPGNYNAEDEHTLRRMGAS